MTPIPVLSMYATCSRSMTSFCTPSLNALRTAASIWPLSRPSVIRPPSSITMMPGSQVRVLMLRTIPSSALRCFRIQDPQPRPLTLGIGQRVWEDLEDDLADQLHVEWLSRSQSRRAVKIADRIAHHAVRAYGTGARRQIDAVEYVEHFRAQLHTKSFFDWNVLENRQIEIGEARPGEDIPPQIAVGIR